MGDTILIEGGFIMFHTGTNTEAGSNILSVRFAAAVDEKNFE